MRLFAGLANALLDSASKFGGALDGAYVVTRSTATGAEDSPCFVTNQRSGAGLAAIDA
jgi:hypothetical protein